MMFASKKDEKEEEEIHRTFRVKSGESYSHEHQERNGGERIKILDKVRAEFCHFT